MRGPTETISGRIKAVLARSPKATAREVADALGLSRSRVYVACKRHGIKLARPPAPPYVYRPERCQHGVRRSVALTPRVITGGVQRTVSPTVCGTISEVLAAADLMARGFRPYAPFVRQRSHDLIAVAPNGRVITIEVRSGRKKSHGGYTFPNRETRSRSDVLAIVLTGEPVIYEPTLEALLTPEDGSQ